MGRVIRSALIMALVTLGCFAAFEVVARVVGWRPLAPQQTATTEFGYGVGGSGDLQPNLDSIVRLYNIRPYYLHTDSLGLRDTDELRLDTFRILAIGDSFTFGMYVHNQEAWPARLEETLNQRGLPRRVQVLNAGVPGYTLEDELAYLKDKGLALHPNLVVLGFYTNDVFDLYPTIRQYFARSVVLADAGAPPKVGPVTRFLRDNSALYNALMGLRAEYQQGQIDAAVNRVTPTVSGLQEMYRDMMFLNPDKPEYKPEWEGYEKLFRETVDLLDSQGIPLVVVAFPDLAQLPDTGGLPDVPQRFLAELTSETNVAYLDLLPVYRNAGDVQSLYLMYFSPDAHVDPNAPDAAVMMYTGDGHPSPYGHLVAARALADLLAQANLLPK
jgi:lysophospholipase L1-like esterase